MRTALIFPVLLVLLCTHVARADLEAGTYAPDIEAKEWINSDEPISLAEYRGMTVVLFFWVSWHPGGESVLPLMNLLNSQYGRSQGVFIIGLTDADRERVEEMLKDQKVYFPVGVKSETYEEYEITSFPRVVVIDANGKISWTGWPGSGGDALVKACEEAVEQAPPTKTHPEDAVIVNRELRKARDALRADDYRDAFAAAVQAHERALTGDPLKARCQDMIELIEALGRDQLAQARRSAEERDFDAAVRMLREVRRSFRGMDVAQQARRTLADLKRKHDEVVDILERENRAALAENALAEALDEFREREFGLAMERLRTLVEEYPQTPAADKARTVIARAEENEGLMGHVRDYEASKTCDPLMAQARAFEKVGRYARARALYRQIIDDFGDTIYADLAAEQLARLPAP
jgi:TolA-binding protein/peroxiredoxin